VLGSDLGEDAVVERIEEPRKAAGRGQVIRLVLLGLRVHEPCRELGKLGVAQPARGRRVLLAAVEVLAIVAAAVRAVKHEEQAKAALEPRARPRAQLARVLRVPADRVHVHRPGPARLEETIRERARVDDEEVEAVADGRVPPGVRASPLLHARPQALDPQAPPSQLSESNQAPVVNTTVALSTKVYGFALTVRKP
jgi:hypothetical protein